MQLFEQYRPRDWDQVVGQDKAVRAIRALEKRSLSGRAYWIAGPSGTGKTTLAFLIAHEVAEPLNVNDLDASGLTPAAIQEIERNCRCRGLGPKSGRVYIVNEAHGLRKDTTRQLLTTLERIPSHVAWIFTTTDAGAALFDGIDANPLLSRCTKLPMSRYGMVEAFAGRAREIAHAEGLDGRPPADYIALVKEHKGNFRSVLQAIEAGAMLTDEPTNHAAEAAECVSQLFHPLGK